MDIDELKTFLEVSRTLHFGRAGENLFVSQSTVSARIRHLEEKLGAPLFKRDRNNIHLTPAGDKFLPLADNLVTTWNRARFLVSNEDQHQLPLVIGAVPSMWEIFVSSWWFRLFNNSPESAFYAEVCDHDTITRRLADGSMDIGFVFEAPHNADIESIEVMRIPLILVSTEKASDVDRAMNGRYVYVDWGQAFAAAHLRHFSEYPVAKLRISHGGLARDFLLQCGGAAYFPEQMVSKQLKNRQLYKVRKAPVIERVAYALLSSRNERQELRHQLVVEGMS